MDSTGVSPPVLVPPNYSSPGCTPWATCNLYFSVSCCHRRPWPMKVSMMPIDCPLVLLADRATEYCLSLDHGACPITISKHSQHVRLHSQRDIRLQIRIVLTAFGEYPSIYLSFPTIQARDGCKQIGTIFFNLTTSLASTELLTVRGTRY